MKYRKKAQIVSFAATIMHQQKYTFQEIIKLLKIKNTKTQRVFFQMNI